MHARPRPIHSTVKKMHCHRNFRRYIVLHLRILAVLLIIGMVPAHANVFGRQDTPAIEALLQRLLNTQKENQSAGETLLAQRAGDDFDCLDKISTEIEKLYAMVSQIDTLLYLSTVMEMPTDEAIVNRSLSLQTRYVLRMMPLQRRTISRHSASCARTPFLATKAQVTLFLLDETERLLQVLSRRL